VVDWVEKPRKFRASTSAVMNTAQTTNSHPAGRFIQRATRARCAARRSRRRDTCRCPG
jgi:hypothetical protein